MKEELFPERIHPQLTNKNILKEMVEACHKRGSPAMIAALLIVKLSLTTFWMVLTFSFSVIDNSYPFKHITSSNKFTQILSAWKFSRDN